MENLKKENDEAIEKEKVLFENKLKISEKSVGLFEE